MKFSVYKKLLKKYHAGEGSDAERQLVEIWYDSFERGETVFDARPNIEEKQRVRERLRTHMRVSSSLSVSAKRSKRLIPWLKGAAAVILLVCGISWLMHSYVRDKLNVSDQQTAHFFTGPGEQKRVALPDGSTVILRANSRLEMKRDANKKQRLVQLSGEAFFDVKSLAGSPFFVETDELLVQVLGTSFHVKAYTYRPTTQVFVYTGRIQVNDIAKTQTWLLRKGEGFDYDQINKRFKKQSAGFANSWDDSALGLKQVTFSELALSFRDIYNLSLTTTDSTVLNRHYTLKLKYQRSASETLKIICHMLNKQYRKEANGYLNIF